MKSFFSSLFVVLILSCGIGTAQEESPVPFVPELVEVEAQDGLILVGDFYRIDPARPTILLIHQLYTTRRSWANVISTLMANSYNVLAVDLRGYGETGGSIQWRQAVNDVAVWFAWLRDVAGVRRDAIMPMGSSMGAVLAIVGCGNEALCPASIALSPGWRYYGISLQESIALKPVLVIYAERDRYPALGVPLMLEASPDRITLLTFSGNTHGMNLLRQEWDEILPRILAWIAERS